MVWAWGERIHGGWQRWQATFWQWCQRSTTYKTPRRYPIVSRDVKYIPHHTSGEIAPAEVIQGHHFKVTTFLDNHGVIVEARDLQDMLITRPVLLLDKIKRGIYPKALEDEYQVDRIITTITQMCKEHLNQVMAYLQGEDVTVESPPFPDIWEKQVKREQEVDRMSIELMTRRRSA